MDCARSSLFLFKANDKQKQCGGSRRLPRAGKNVQAEKRGDRFATLAMTPTCHSPKGDDVRAPQGGLSNLHPAQVEGRGDCHGLGRAPSPRNDNSPLSVIAREHSDRSNLHLAQVEGRGDHCAALAMTLRRIAERRMLLNDPHQSEYH